MDIISDIKMNYEHIGLKERATRASINYLLVDPLSTGLHHWINQHGQQVLLTQTGNFDSHKGLEKAQHGVECCPLKTRKSSISFLNQD